MGPALFQEFLEDEFNEKNINDYLATFGAAGLLEMFEDWLVARGNLDRSK